MVQIFEFGAGTHAKRRERAVPAYGSAREALADGQLSQETLYRLLYDFQEDERRRVASDLHDSIGASLTVIKFHLEAALGRLGEKGTDEELRPLRDASAALKGAIEEVRRIAMNLKPAILEDLGLVPALNWYCRELVACDPTLKIEKSIQICEAGIPTALKTAVFRVLQEATSNTIKHSRASLLRITLVRADSTMRLSVEDNGCGFDTEAVRRVDGRAGYGVVGMRQRVQGSGGSLTILSNEGVGTLVVADWPMQSA